MGNIEEERQKQIDAARAAKPKPSREAFDIWYAAQQALPESDDWRRRAEESRKFLEEFGKYVVFNDTDDYATGDIVAINKPAGISTHGNGKVPPYGIAELAKLATDNSDIITVHRLDVDTSGVLILGKNRPAVASLHEQFDRTRGKGARKRYVALVQGNWSDKTAGVVVPLVPRDDRLGMEVADTETDEGKKAKTAATGVSVVARFADDSNNPWTLLSMRLVTGRTHQLRVSTSYLDHPIAGDPLYGEKEPEMQGQLLHAYQISLRYPVTDPTSENRLVIKAPLPATFRQRISAMKLLGTPDPLLFRIL